MLKKTGNENGMMIVEATIVFPVIFMVIFLMLFTGNAFYQKCRIDAYVNKAAIEGAAHCANPLLEHVEAHSMPSCNSINLEPYRYIFTGGMTTLEERYQDELKKQISGMSTGLFSNMRPKIISVNVEFHNGFIYSTLSAEAKCKIEIPVRLLGAKNNLALSISSHVDMPVQDTVEFIRNINLVEDYLQRYGIDKKIDQFKEKISAMVDKVSEFFDKNINSK